MRLQEAYEGKVRRRREGNGVFRSECIRYSHENVMMKHNYFYNEYSLIKGQTGDIKPKFIGRLEDIELVMETKFQFSLPQLCPPRVCSVCHIWRGCRHRSRYKVLFSKSISDCPFIMSSSASATQGSDSKKFKMTRGAQGSLSESSMSLSYPVMSLRVRSSP